MSATIEAWHFLRSDGCLKYPPHTKVEAGMTFRLPDGQTPILCWRGWHASVRAIDALRYAPGPIICRVRPGGEIIHDDDKMVASERTVLWMADATNVLHECACLFAEEALRISKVNDPRSHEAIDAKRKWLRGEITDAELDAAGAAAWAAARDAAMDAARAAAWDAARAAAGAAARAAAWDAAWDAAWAAAKAAAWDAAMDAAWAAVRDAAKDAAWAAVRDAAEDAQNTLLERELDKLGGAA